MKAETRSKQKIFREVESLSLRNTKEKTPKKRPPAALFTALLSQPSFEMGPGDEVAYTHNQNIE